VRSTALTFARHLMFDHIARRQSLIRMTADDACRVRRSTNHKLIAEFINQRLVLDRFLRVVLSISGRAKLPGHTHVQSDTRQVSLTYNIYHRIRPQRIASAQQIEEFVARATPVIAAAIAELGDDLPNNAIAGFSEKLARALAGKVLQN
jgi:hypothetical protein